MINGLITKWRHIKFNSSGQEIRLTSPLMTRQIEINIKVSGMVNGMKLKLPSVDFYLMILLEKSIYRPFGNHLCDVPRQHVAHDSYY